MTGSMTVDQLLQALALPESTRVQQRVPKKLLVEHGAATAQDKRLIQDGVDEITWLASLKPHLIGVPDFEDEHRHYREAAVLGLTLRPGTRPARLVELLHRAVPHPLMLATTVDGHLGVSVAHLRRSQTEAEQMVLDGPPMSVQVPPDGGGAAFRADPSCPVPTGHRPRYVMLHCSNCVTFGPKPGSFAPWRRRSARSPAKLR